VFHRLLRNLNAPNTLILSQVLGTPLFGPGPKQPIQSRRRDGRTGGASSAKVQVTDDSGWHSEHGITGWEGVTLTVLVDQLQQMVEGIIELDLGAV
jgi:hypothetical protein